jgi:hypothetical protein
MIDLHMHTNYSDGTCTVRELLEEAQKKKLECISITDHDTCLSYDDLRDENIRKLFKGKMICGCELKSIVEGTVIEILGYNVDPNMINREITKLEPTYEQINLHEVDVLLEIIKKKGYQLDMQNIHFNPKNESGQTAIIEELLSHPENSKFKEETNYQDPFIFYREHMSNPSSSYFVDNSGLIPTPDKVIELIREAGGLAFIPHTFIYGENSMKVFHALTDTRKVDGIECYYSKFTKEQTEFLLKFCRENHYYISGGSDYHGTYKPNISMATGTNYNLNIPFEITKPWAKYI